MRLLVFGRDRPVDVSVADAAGCDICYRGDLQRGQVEDNTGGVGVRVVRCRAFVRCRRGEICGRCGATGVTRVKINWPWSLWRSSDAVMAQ
jgi:hypothetical protein